MKTTARQHVINCVVLRLWFDFGHTLELGFHLLSSFNLTSILTCHLVNKITELETNGIAFSFQNLTFDHELHHLTLTAQI